MPAPALARFAFLIETGLNFSYVTYTARHRPEQTKTIVNLNKTRRIYVRIEFIAEENTREGKLMIFIFGKHFKRTLHTENK